jgi:hypothetical protein
VAIERVTPRTAESWLKKNTRNRSLRETRVFGLVGVLQRDEWRLTGDCVVFDTEGALLNGQHRLTAIVESGVAADLVVLRGVEPEAQDVMDRGLPRSLADTLKMRGHKSWFGLASALNWTFRLDYIERTGNVHYSVPGERPTTPQALKVLEDNPDLPTYVKDALPVVRMLKLRNGLTAALYHRFALIDPNDADAFMDRLCSGLELTATSPIHHLRKMLVLDANATARMPDYRVAAVTCKAWNAWREGKPVQSLAWKYGGTQKEAFPVPR